MYQYTTQLSLGQHGQANKKAEPEPALYSVLVLALTGLLPTGLLGDGLQADDDHGDVVLAALADGIVHEELGRRLCVVHRTDLVHCVLIRGDVPKLEPTESARSM
jgi:hypothetical protein